jgi:serine/threonine protein kinase
MDENSLLGTTFAETYLIEQKLGEGGMGTVFIARNVRLGKRYALKVLNPEVAQSYPQAVERFKREAVTAGRLGHVGIVQVHDIAQTEEGILYMVMDLLDGEDLETRMAETGLLPWDAVYRIFKQTCDALATAHEAGIVHRDLKPANIFLSRRRGEGERAVLLDFGVAKVLDAQRALPEEESMAGGRRIPTPTLTKPGTIVGTPNYMSPEQASGIAVDHRSDVYSMGAVLYHMAAGEPPFNADSLLAVLTMIAIDPVPRIADVSPGAGRPPILDEIIAKAMAKSPEDRFQDIRAFADALPKPSGASLIAVPSTLRQDDTGDFPIGADRVEGPPTAHETPVPKLGKKTKETLHDGVAAKTKIETLPGGAASLIEQPAATTTSPKKRSLGLTLIGVFLAIGIAAGAIAAIGPRLFGDNGSSGTSDLGQADAGARSRPSEDLFSQGMSALQRDIEAENWASAAGQVAKLTTDFPARKAVLHPMREQIEMEMLSAAQHRNAKSFFTTNAERARSICSEIEARSIYRGRPPCLELLAKAAPPADAGARDTGPDKAQKQTPSRPARLSDREIDRVYRKNRFGASRCFDRAFEGGFRPTGTIRVAVQATIGSTGRVTSASLLDPRYRSKAAFKVCIENHVRSWQFPSSTGSTTREFQFTFKGQEINLDDL